MNFATATAAELAAAGFTLKTLKARKARKGERLAERVGGGTTRWAPAARAPRDGGSRRKAGAAAVR